MKKIIVILFQFSIMLVLVTACGGGQQESTEINVLCPPREEQCEGMKQAFEEKFGIKVSYARMSTSESLTRLREEKDDPQFDIWWGGPVDSYIVAKQEGLLEAYNSPNYINLIDQEKYKDPDNYWGGVYVGSLGFCTNTDWLAKHPGVEPPHSWDDLLKPEFEGQIMVAHPSTSGTSYTVMSTILQLKGEEEGWSYLNDLSDQIFQFTRSGAIPPKFIGEGEAGVCITSSHEVIYRIEDGNLPLVLTFPDDGTGYEIGGMAIVKGAKHPDAAKKWFDWALTSESQAIGPKYQAYQGPTVKDTKVAYPELLEVNLIDYDFVWAAERKDEFIKKFTKDIAAADNLRK
ncbi:MAG: hypothetical protein B6242_01920 [Anaerolineaceae bacterium 4572_78]|nr:MAG: hypothetical protein B6242_01920 [Anaerolineaceae bacterium 4572_78]